MNKKGFISISIIYSFLLVFIAVVFSILAMYASRRLNMMEIQKDVKNLIDSKSNFDCLSSGITNLGECIIHKYGGESAIKNQPSPNFSVATTEGEYGLYTAQDDYGDSYYFRGAVPDNYVRFAKNEEGVDMYWRIVRINGDGTIRLIYDGTSAVANGTSHTATIGKTAYNTNYNDAKYVGYTYDNSGTQTDSTIKGVIDTWYDEHLETTYGSYIADSIFCNDREVTSSNENGNVYYAPYSRLSTNKTPTLTCTNKADRYTVSDTTNGNGLLTNPVGLITADEAFFAGGSKGSNSSYYLYSGEMYWTSAPHYFGGGSANVRGVDSDGYVVSYSVGLSNPGARPVINLVSNIEIKSGKGTVASPYILKEVN